MREILFRGKTEQGEWLYGYLVKGNYNTGFGIIEDHIDKGLQYVKEETVGQFTGLNDKNGKKIFENGYIIIDNETYKVTFNNAEYILTNIFNCDTITLKNNSIRGVFVDEI